MNVHSGRTLALILGLCLLMTLACQMATDAVTDMAVGEKPAQETAVSRAEDQADGEAPASVAGEAAEITAAELAEALASETTDERPEVLALLGRPDAFKMTVLEVEGGQIRRESWWYYALGTQVDFVDGGTIWTLEVTPAPEGSIFPAWYDPLAFEPGMPAVAAIQLATEASPAGLAPEIIDVAAGGDDLVGGLVLVGDQILIGVQDDQVIYVETVPLFAEEG